jgi:hypothetical protein
LNHGQILEATMSTRAAKHLAERFGGDPSSADWRHRAARGIHQSEAGTAVAVRAAAVRAAAIS